jgi:hypothetical protein
MSYHPAVDNDWFLLFSDIVTHQEELKRKLAERYQFSQSFLFPSERRQAQAYLTAIEQGFTAFYDAVVYDNRYIDFGSGKREEIVGPRGRATAIIQFLESTNRALADFRRFLEATTTPEAVEAKCEALPADECGGPCRPSKPKLFGLVHGKCRPQYQ